MMIIYQLDVTKINVVKKKQCSPNLYKNCKKCALSSSTRIALHKKSNHNFPAGFHSDAIVTFAVLLSTQQRHFFAYNQIHCRQQLSRLLSRTHFQDFCVYTYLYVRTLAKHLPRSMSAPLFGRDDYAFVDRPKM